MNAALDRRLGRKEEGDFKLVDKDDDKTKRDCCNCQQ